MTRNADLEALRRRRDESALRADELAEQYDRFPHNEIKRELEAACRKVDAFDRAITECST